MKTETALITTFWHLSVEVWRNETLEPDFRVLRYPHHHYYHIYQYHYHNYYIEVSSLEMSALETKENEIH